ncbi:MAG: PulJ/GspJ family protein [Candidatus Omnitrophota bacterium]
MSAKNFQCGPALRGSSSSLPRGFTLIELLVVTSILAVVMLAVYSSFSTGMKLWRNSRQSAGSAFRMVTGLEKVSAALRQAVVFSPVGFNGSASEVSFPAVKEEEIVRVSLSFDAGTNSLMREEKYFRDIRDDRNVFTSRLLIPNIDNAQFSYFCLDGPTQKYLWKTDWKSEEGIPLAVKVNIQSQNEPRQTIVFIPIA